MSLMHFVTCLGTCKFIVGLMPEGLPDFTIIPVHMLAYTRQ